MSIFNIIFILSLDMLYNLLPIQIKVVIILRIEKPIGNLSALVDGKECQPVSGYSQHQVQHQRFFFFVLSKLGEFLC